MPYSVKGSQQRGVGMGLTDGLECSFTRFLAFLRGRKGQEETVGLKYLSPVIPICSHGKVTAQLYLCYLLSRKT